MCMFSLLFKKNIKHLFIYGLFLINSLYYCVSIGMAQEILSESTPNDGGRLILGSIGEPSNLIPYLATDSASSEIISQLYTALLDFNKDLQIVPLAARSWESLEDGKRLRFVLRDDIFWSDGVPLTADDIEFTYKLMIDPKTPTAYAEDFLAIKTFRKLDTYSFEVEYEKPFARAVMTWLGAILPKHILENQDLLNSPLARKPISSGPFTLKEWIPGTQLTLEASDTYFLGRPYIDEVVTRIIPDPSTMFLELKAGRLDSMGLSPQQYLRQTTGAEWEKNWKKYRYLSGSYTFLGYNLKHPFFQDVRVRQAIGHAIDRQALVQGVLWGQGIAAFGPYKPETWPYHQTLEPFRFDPQRAKRLLGEAGWIDDDQDGTLERDGIPFAFTILTNQGNDQRIKTATIIQSQLKAVGIAVTIRTVEWAAFIREFVNKGRFDALILGWTITQDPDIFDVWHSSKAVEGGLNFTGYKNAEVDELLIKARATTNQTVRKKLYDRFQEILHEEQPYAFLYVPYALPIVQARFHGIKAAPAGIMYNLDRWWVPTKEQRITPF